MTRKTAIREGELFLNKLFGSAVSRVAQISIWCKGDRNSRFFTDIQNAAKYAVAQALHDRDVYFGCGLYRPGITSGRGKAEDVVAVTSLWCDLDCGKGRAFTSKPEAIRWIRASAPTPSIIVDSGGGYHVYWKIGLFELRSDTDKSLPKRWVRHLQHKAAVKGLKLDSVGDLSRVLRLPGTSNCKGMTPRPVTIYHRPVPGIRYSVGSLIERIRDTEKRSQEIAQGGGELSRLRVALAKLADERASDYQSWLTIGMAIQSEAPGDDGLALWKAFSQRTLKDNYDSKACTAKWKTFAPDGGITVSTIYDMANRDSASGKSKDGIAPARLANLLVTQFEPVQYVDGTLYRYAQGLWVGCEDDVVGAAAMKLLGPAATTSRIRDAVQLVKYQVLCASEDFASNLNYVNLQNGMLDIRSRKIRPHAPKYNSRSQLPFEYDPDAKCPRWKRFLKEVFADDLGKAKTLQQWFGYCLTYETFLQIFMLFVGSGQNGKGVALHVLCCLVGERNFCAIPLDRLERDFVLVKLQDKLVNLSGEIDTSKPLNASMMKVLTGEDVITVDKKYSDPITFKPYAETHLRREPNASLQRSHSRNAAARPVPGVQPTVRRKGSR